MDILRFVNSKDIREYLKNINYQFNYLEASWLIYQCKSATIKEKHEAWHELIATMPDCEILKRGNTDPQKSLHEYLHKYMKAENDMLEYVTRENENCIYFYEWFENGEWFDDKMCFSSFRKCVKRFTDSFSDDMPLKYKITKQEIDSRSAITIVFSANNEPIDYEMSRYPENRFSILYEVFDGLWFDFPTPFEKGDILCDYDEFGMELSGLCCGPFVMTAITPDHASEHTRKYGDTSDMNVWGYYQNKDGSIFSEVTWNYMNLEYYRGELCGTKRILKGLSNCIKGRLGIDAFANVYHQILCEEYTKSLIPGAF